MIRHRNKPVLVCKEPWMKEKELNKFLSFVGYLVFNKQILFQILYVGWKDCLILIRSWKYFKI